jgi:crossover junction endodeoxyribonuclease RusA
VLIEFAVPGQARPKGSTRNVGRTRKGAAILRASNADQLEPWCATVTYFAKQAMRERGLTVRGDCAFRVGLTFRFPRPRCHYGRRGLLPSAPAHHTQRPDMDKLERACLDALTGVVWRDDSQVIGHLPDDGKRWAEGGEEGGVLVQIEVVGEVK